MEHNGGCARHGTAKLQLGGEERLTMDEPSVLSSVLEGSITRVVSQRQGLMYGCSSTVQASFPLSAGSELWQSRGPRAGGPHAARRSLGGPSGRGARARGGGRRVCGCESVANECLFVHTRTTGPLRFLGR